MSLMTYVPRPEGFEGWYPVSAAQMTAIHTPAQMLMFGGAAGPGKLLDLNTRVPTPTGWTTVGQLKVGDEVFDEAGVPCSVTFLSAVEPKPSASKLLFDDGSQVVACDDHLWRTYTARDLEAMTKRSIAYRLKRRIKRASRAKSFSLKPNVSIDVTRRNKARGERYEPAPVVGAIKTTREIADSLRTASGRANHAIPVCGALVLPEAELPLDPYVLGAWLGDGTSAGGGFTSVDQPICDEIRKAGFEVRQRKSKSMDHCIIGLAPTLRAMGLLNNKHIPQVFLRASAGQRLALLQGLMDTDGHCDSKSGFCEFSSVNPLLAPQVYELAVSLGIKATIREGVAKLYGRAIGPKWRVCFTTKLEVFRLARKAQRLPHVLRRTTQFRYIVGCSAAPSVPMRCLQVSSPSHLFLVGDSMIATHNTSLIIADAARERDNPNLRGLVLRESYPQLEKSVLPKMRELYSQMGGTYVEGSKRRWRFPSGAEIRLGFISRLADIGDYQGGEYSLIDIDESTHHPEAHIRNLLPWWRTLDPSLFKRIRLATNPGGRGADWHLHTFLNNKCPYHFPALSVKPGAIYKNATWLSDGSRIPFTVSFIPGLSTDHNMHGPDFRELLATQSGERAEQLLHGCWCSLEGAYFPFLRESDLVEYAEIHDAWWWNHFISIDYGFGNSSAAAGLYAVDEAGRVYKVDGFTESKMGSSDFARECIRRWVEPKLGPERRRIIYVVCDPANDAHTGTGESNMDIMGTEFAKFDVPMVTAHKGRVDNFQRLYRGLKNGEFMLCKPHAMQTFRSLATREHHEKIPGDIRKDHGNPLDDVLDETAYAFNTWIQSANKPGRIAMEEAIAKMRADGLDEHSLMIHGHRMQQAIAKKEQPIKIGRGGRIGERRVVRR